MKPFQHQQSLLNVNKVFYFFILCILPAIARPVNNDSSKEFIIDNNTSYYITNDTWAIPPTGGDTVFILSTRTNALRFQNINGSENNPVVVINRGGQVQINSPESWGAITFENCTNIKISGNGHPGFKYGFKLAAKTCGLAFSELSSDCEAEFIKIDHDGFFGIFAKKDYQGNPPSPAPVFSNLIIHDCLILNVTEGMYLGETKSPGMEFRHVKIYNNIIKNTGRESIQIANMVEDVEIYNNTLLMAGTDGELYQSNILQIGDNSVAKVYNNILIGAPSFGVISMGVGNNIITNNYISSCKGIFTDNRLFTVAGYPIVIADNYFTNMISTEVIKNMNEINFVDIKGNNWDSNIPLYKNLSGNNNNYILSNNQNITVETISFTNSEENDFSLAAGTPEKYLNIGAPGGLEYSLYEEPVPEVKTPKQIVLTPEMLVDELKGGSYWSAGYLIDEQTSTPENNFHPVSQSWKPYWNMDKGPYHVYIDLKSMHHVTNISLHDMHNTKNLEISTGEPGNWQPLFTEPCEKYIAWKQHTTNVSTRYIRLSMIESVFAAVNELVIFGYSEVDIFAEKSANLESQLTVSTQYLENQSTQSILCQNPVVNSLSLIIPQELCVDFTIEIIDIKGNPVFTENYPNINQSQLLIDLSRFNISNGIYLLKYLNKSGISKTLKFIKNGY